MSKTSMVLVVAALLFPGVAQGGTEMRLEDPEDPDLAGLMDIRALTVTNDAQNLYVIFSLRDLSKPDPTEASSHAVSYIFEWVFKGVTYTTLFYVEGAETTHRGLGYGPITFVPGVPLVQPTLIPGPGSVVYGYQGSSRFFHNDGIEANLNIAENTLTLTIPLVMTLTRSTGSEEDLTAVAEVGQKITIARVLTGTHGIVQKDTVDTGQTYTLR